MPPSPAAGGAAALPPPRLPPFSAQRLQTGTRPLTSKPCDVKYVPAERHFRRRGRGQWGWGGAVRLRPHPRLVLRGQLLAQRREFGGAKGLARRDGTGRGCPAGCGVGVPREPWLGRREGGRLSFAGGRAQPAGGSEAESPRCGEGEEGAPRLGVSTFAPLSWEDGAGAPGNVAGTLGSVLSSMLLRSGCVFIRARAGCCTGFWVRLRPAPPAAWGSSSPTLLPTPPRRGPPTCRLPVSSLPSRPCPYIGPSVARRPVSPTYLSGRVAPAPARLLQPGWRRRFYRRA